MNDLNERGNDYLPALRKGSSSLNNVVLLSNTRLGASFAGGDLSTKSA